MDKATLVKSDLDAEGRVLNALSLARIPATLVDLEFVPSLDEWQLVIATPLYDDKGPLEAYSKVIRALQDAGIYQDVPIRRISLKSPSDAFVKALVAEVKEQTEGTIHILEIGGLSEARRPTEYSVTFAPYTGSGGAVPSRRFQRLISSRPTWKIGLALIRVRLMRRLPTFVGRAAHPYSTSDSPAARQRDSVWLDKPSGSKPQAPAALTPAKRLNFNSGHLHQDPALSIPSINSAVLYAI